MLYTYFKFVIAAYNNGVTRVINMQDNKMHLTGGIFPMCIIENLATSK